MINVEYQNYPDGTYSVEKTYVKHNNLIGTMSATSSGTDTFTKTKEWYASKGMSLVCSAEVTATFDWDTSTKKVQVYDAEGEVLENDGADLTNEKTTTSGNNKRKATAKFSFTRTTNLGFTHNYSVRVSCNYKGTDS